jgi:ketosteroid isomerase-like protein
MLDREQVEGWVARYEQAWRSPGTAALADVFADGAVYRPSPWAPPLTDTEALRRFWDAGRDSAHEGFRLTSEVVAVDDPVAVVRVHVDYDDGQRWRDLWVVTLDEDGRCTHFEEWPFAPDQDDGHADHRT